MRTLIVAMDAADDELVMRWAGEGKLPALARLIERGSAIGLSSETGFGPEATWPTLATGCMPGKHGIYNWRIIRPGTELRVEAPAQAYRRTFWSYLADEGHRLLLVDVRRGDLLRAPGTTEIVGWGERGGTRHESWPDGLFEEITETHGRYPRGLSREHRGWLWMSANRLRILNRMSERRTAMLSEQMRKRDWDLCLTGYYEPHYAGHEFHRFLVPGQWGWSRRGERLLGGALLRTYQAFDRGLDELIRAAGDGCNVIVFSGYGMRPNTNGHRVLSEMLSGLGYWARRPESPSVRRREMARRAAMRVVPRGLARAVRERLLDEQAIDRHLEQIWEQSTDWAQTRAYAECEAGHAYVRISALGAPERETLRSEITDHLLSLVDADTGRPAIERVLTREEATEGPHVGELPDLAIEWSREGMLRRVRHPQVGVIEEEMRELQRSEHTARGFMIAAGPGIARGASAEGAHLADVAPTILRLLGAPIPREMDGSTLDSVIADNVAPARLAEVDWSDDPWRA